MADGVTTDLGVFDSGVGGLSVLRELRALLPHDNIVYVADSANVPYGTKPPALIRERSMAIARFLVEKRQARAVVVACNTATTYAVDLLRQTFSNVPFVLMFDLTSVWLIGGTKSMIGTGEPKSALATVCSASFCAATAWMPYSPL